jgi:tRNA (guanine-N7-)-methyltransferase
MVEHIDAHPLFRRLTQDELDHDICIPHVMQDTEEGKKVARNSGDKFLAVYERVADPLAPWNGFDNVGVKDDKEEEDEKDDDKDE